MRRLITLLLFLNYVVNGQQNGTVLAGVSVIGKCNCWDSSNNLKSVSKYGFIDTLGNEVIPAIYDASRSYSWDNNLITVNKGLITEEQTGAFIYGGKWGFVNIKGEEVIALKYDNWGIFNEGFAVVKKDSNYVMIDTTGNIVLSSKALTQYDHFGNGLLPLCFKDSTSYVNRYGKQVFSIPYDGGGFIDGFARIARDNKDGWIKGLIDTTGKVLTDCIYHEISFFYNGRAIVDTLCNKNHFERRKYGFIDTKGKTITPVKYDIVRDFGDDSIALVGILKDTSEAEQFHFTIGFIDYNGNEIIRPQYKAAYGFENGHTVVANDQEQYGIIDKTGKTILPFNWLWIEPIDSNRFIAKKIGDSLAQIINIKGERILPLQYPNLWYLGHNLFQIPTKDSILMIVNDQNKIVVKTKEYELVQSHYSYGVIQIKDTKTNKLGLMDKTGKIILTPKYESIDEFCKTTH